MISLSLCMIVKNEEKVLPRILKPMKEIVDKFLSVIPVLQTGPKKLSENLQQKFMIFHGKMIFLLPGILFRKKSVLITGCGWMQTT